MLKNCLLFPVFLFTYFAYSCEDVFDSNLQSEWLTAQELSKLMQNSQAFHRPGMFRVEYRPAVEKAKPLKRVPKEILNKRIIHYLDFSLVGPSLKGQLNRFLREQIEVRNSLEKQEMTEHGSHVNGSAFTNGDVIVYIGDLISKSREELLAKEHMGPKTLDAFERALAQRGLRLGMKVDVNWTPPSSRDISAEVLSKKVFDYLDFSFVRPHTLNEIKRRLGWGFAAYYGEVVYIGELIQLSARELLEHYRVSQNNILVIERALAERGLYLGTTLPKKWERPAVGD